MDFNKIIEQVLLYTLPPLAAAITAYCVTYVKEYIDTLAEKKRRFVLDLIRVGVNAAEQLYKGENRGDEKKSYVLGFVNKALTEKGIKINVWFIEAQIEAAVFSQIPKNEYKG